MIFTIIRLFTQAFKVTDDLIQLKSIPEAFPSDGRLCLEILKVHENTMTLPEIYRKLPDFCRSRISNLSDLENFFERFPDFLDPPPKIPNNKSDWDHIKNELSSLASVIRIVDEESLDEVDAFTKRVVQLSDSVKAFHLSKSNEQTYFEDLIPIEKMVDGDVLDV